MSLFNKNSDSFLGVDIGAGGIKLVELKKNKGRAQLWTYGLAERPMDVHKAAPLMQTDRPLPESPMQKLVSSKKNDELKQPEDNRVEIYAKTLKNLLKEAKVTSNRVTASLPVSYVFHAVITLPKVDKKEVAHHVEAKVKKMLPRPIEEMQVVHQVIPEGEDGDKKNIRVLVTAAPKDLIRFYTSIFSKAGLQLEELETEAFALERSLVGRDKSTAMIVDIGAERTNFFIVDQGLPLVHRSISLGGVTFDNLIKDRLGIDGEAVGQIKKDLSRLPKEKLPKDIFMPVVDPIIKEIQYGFDMFLHQTGNQYKRPEKIILTGGSAVFPPIVDAIEVSFPLKVFVGDPWARTVYQQALKPVLDELGPSMAVSIGLALRNIV